MVTPVQTRTKNAIKLAEAFVFEATDAGGDLDPARACEAIEIAVRLAQGGRLYFFTAERLRYFLATYCQTPNTIEEIQDRLNRYVNDLGVDAV